MTEDSGKDLKELNKKIIENNAKSYRYNIIERLEQRYGGGGVVSLDAMDALNGDGAHKNADDGEESDDINEEDVCQEVLGLGEREQYSEAKSWKI